MSNNNSQPRQPQQKRGLARVKAILDATASLVAAGSVEAVTVHAIADRAHTSIGSMYHFFPDLDSVLQALMDRHYEALKELNVDLVGRHEGKWARAHTEDVVDAFHKPIIAYMEKHPDALVLLRSNHPAAAGPGTRSGLLEMLDRVLAVRAPRANRRQRSEQATIMIGMMTGIPGALGWPHILPAWVKREMRRALVSYLGALEREYK